MGFGEKLDSTQGVESCTWLIHAGRTCVCAAYSAFFVRLTGARRRVFFRRRVQQGCKIGGLRSGRFLWVSGRIFYFLVAY